MTHESVRIQAKALWLLGEIGLTYPLSVQKAVPVIVSFCDSSAPLLRERAVNALGRIGRGDFHVIEKDWTGLFRFAYGPMSDRPRDPNEPDPRIFCVKGIKT